MSAAKKTAALRLLWPAAVFALGLVLATQGGWIQLKAGLAQILLQQAWTRTLADGQVHKAWPWADHWPVAELRFPQRHKRYIVLEGDQGNVLAFAPGHSPQSGLADVSATTVISGHRDTHFRLLEYLQPGEAIVLITPTRRVTYKVAGTRVFNADKKSLPLHPTDELDLVTCWPFSAVAVGGPLRYVVHALPAPENVAGNT